MLLLYSFYKNDLIMKIFNEDLFSDIIKDFDNI